MAPTAITGRHANGFNSGMLLDNDSSLIAVKKNTHKNAHYDGNISSSAHDHSITDRRTSQTEQHIKRTGSYASGFSSFSSNQQTTEFLSETITITRSRFISEIGHVNTHYVDSITLEGLLGYIELERLTNMPQRGSIWDKVLKWAEFFALQISGYEKAVRSFVPDSKTAAKLIWASCRILIELGPDNAQAVEAAFEAFYKLGLSLSFFLRHHDLLSANPHIRSDVGQAFASLLTVVREVCLYYSIHSSGLSETTTIDFGAEFGKSFQVFYRHKNHIVDAMWKCKAQETGDISFLRQWLNVHDKTTRQIIRDRSTAAARRDEYTCDWFRRHLLDFSRGKDNVLAIYGPVGCGKTFLSGWILERLQRPLDRKVHETLTYTIDSEIPRERTSIAVAKSLALQLLEINIGDVSLLKALSTAYDMSFTSTDVRTLEKALWAALDTGMDNFKSTNLMIVIDGLNTIDGHSKDNSISKRIEALASKHAHVQAVLLCRKVVHLHNKSHSLEITPDISHNDLRHITKHALHGYQHFEDRNDHEKESIVEQLCHASKGNFLWILLASNPLKKETTHDGFMKAVTSLKEGKHGPRSLHDIIEKLATFVDLNNWKTKLLISWLLIAERPLRVEEIRSLFQVDLQKKHLSNIKENLEEEVALSFGPLVMVRNGVVSFRHEAVRSYFAQLQVAGKNLPSIKSAQTEFTMRLLAYCKFRHMDECQPTFEGFSKADADSLFQKDHLMEYALRNWLFHFKESSFYKGSGAFEFSPEFNSVFPDNVQCSLLEAYCWDADQLNHEAISMHRLALQIRRKLFTENHPSVLQTLITCGNLQRRIGDMTEAANSFYQASMVSRSILEKYSTLTIRCVTTFLEVSDVETYTSRTELVTRREDMLKYIIEASRHRYGHSSDFMIRYSKMLAELYVCIHEESLAEAIWRELREVVITRHGKGSEEETSISGQLDVVLKKGQRPEDITQYEREVFVTETEIELWDINRIKITLELAVLYEGQGKIFEAEELYIMLWSRIIQHSHGVRCHTFGMDIHISMIDIVMEYVGFLRRFHRHEEATGILICIWNEYEEYDFDSEIIFLRLKSIGELMMAMSLSSIAILVFRKCGAWFQAHSKYEYAESCEMLISETTAEIIETTLSISTTTTTADISRSTSTSKATEISIEESFQSVISGSKATIETISICSRVIAYHVELQQWSKAIEVSKKSLEIIWKTVISGVGTIALPREFGLEAIDIAISLAMCHHRSHHFHEAEEIYLRIYRACWNSCHFDDKRLTRAYTELIKFYEEHQHWSKVIEIYQELLSAARKQMGTSHSMTIKFLYALGDIGTQHGHPHAYEYYEKIITVLNRHEHDCHKDAVNAMMALCKFYFEGGHWQKLQTTCGLLWETWVHRQYEYLFEADFIEILYARYVYVLDHHFHANYEFIRTLTIQYRETCLSNFGASTAITVRALLELAEVCMRSEKYRYEAISHYEEVIKIVKSSTSTSKSIETTTTTISTLTISSVEEKLSSAYMQICRHGSITSTTAERAIQVLKQRFGHLKITLGYSHTETLLVLRELLLLQCKFTTEEMREKATKTLIDVTVMVISKETHSKALYAAAKSLGGIYVSCGLIEEGRKMLQELRGQIIGTTDGKHHKCGFSIDRSSVGKASYVFLVSFEEALMGSLAVSYSKLMADLLTEAFLYESYTRCMKSQKIDAALIAGARLYVFLLDLSRMEEVLNLQEELSRVFLRKWGSGITTSTETTTIFLVTLLKELGKGTSHTNIGPAACIASNAKVRDLLEQGNFKEAFEIAQCAFQFFVFERTYYRLQNVGYGFKLSAYMAFRGLRRNSSTPVDPKLHASMLDLSRTIIRDVLKACKQEKVNFVQLKIGEINDLVGLLGQQENYSDLEWLLQSLWSSREVQKNWSSDTITAIGKCLVQAIFLLERRNKQGNPNYSKAFSLCEAICYNLRRVGGGLSPKALAVSELLSQMYTATGHFREAMAVHEEILRLVVEGDDGNDITPDTVQPHLAKYHLEMLKRSYQRLGGWDKKQSVYKDLVDRLLAMPEYNDPIFKGVTGIEKWEVRVKVDDGMGQFEVPKMWEFIDPNLLNDNGELVDRKNSDPLSRGLGVRRASSNWGMGSVYEDLFGN